MWFVYIIQCSDNTFYTWITTDVNRRLEEHNLSDKAAKYTRARRPVVLVYESTFSSKSEASKEEYRIKKLSRNKKEDLIKKGWGYIKEPID